jgi:hypothetical protein
MGRMRGYLAGIVTGAVLAGMVGVAMAEIPDSGGVVHACYQKVSGATKPGTRRRRPSGDRSAARPADP